MTLSRDVLSVITGIGNQVARGGRLTTGNTFFVDSGAGTASNHGRDKRHPLLTLQAALDKCTADNGDVIYLMPGHAETLTATLELDVAGIAIIGIGDGGSRPTFTMGATAADITLTAASVTLENVLVLLAVTINPTKCISMEAADGVLRSVHLREGSAAEALIYINLTVSAVRCIIEECNILGPTAGSNAGIQIAAALTDLTVRNCVIYGDFADACIQNPTANVAARLRIHDNLLVNEQSGDHAIQLVSACSGIIARNMFGTSMADATPDGLDGGACFMFENYGHDAGGNNQGLLNPAADA